ncbi:anaerobic sulfatase maturase [Pseudocitrobacter sp. 73]|uniref:anaerobic sulfatase maturase n=1 Tax=Pseudocitrobacter sp. 73 TaxID=2605731 RepID=UPI00165E8929|nr:anaerobic sulfatase maturase [Pseudocitrobacter sp. 73]
MTGCQVMVKPASSRCNLRCRYCFYIEKPQQSVMDDDTLEAFIRQHIDAQPGDEVLFAWQGGEPTLCGLDYFKRVVALQRRYANGKRIANAFQTNGILLNEAWCRFFHEHNWLVGVSIDGPAPLHDALRVSTSGKPTHHKVVEAIHLLTAHRVEFNLLVVVNSLNSQHPQALYRYLRKLGTPFIQFIPLVERDENGNLTAESLTGQRWGEFLTRVFSVWVREDIGRVYVQLFDSTLGVWSGYPAQMCAQSERCGHAFALESNGDLYQCDHYVYPAYRLGNIHEQPLKVLNVQPEVAAFGANKQRALTDACRQCPVIRLCQGDCPKHRLNAGKSALCEGYRQFFTDTAPHMKIMRDLLKHHRSPVELMVMLQRS